MRVDITTLELLRTRLNERFERSKGPRVSVTVLCVKMVAGILRRHSRLNSTLHKNQMVLFSEINQGATVGLPDGLINPGAAASQSAGATRDEVVPVNGQVEIRPVLCITLPADHRIVNGAVAHSS